MENTYKLDVTTSYEKCKEAGINYKLVSHAVMGLIRHFICREWITDNAYVYIQKGVQYIEIKEKYFEDFKKRVREMGIAQYVEYKHILNTEEDDVLKYNGTEHEGEDYDENWEHKQMTKGLD